MVHGTVHIFFRLIAAFATLLLCGLAVLVWRLSSGPVVIDFLAPYVAEAISNQSEGVVFSVDGASLTWDGLRTAPEITVIDVTAVDLEGAVIAAFPEMLVRLSAKSIFEGAPSPKEIVLENPVVRLTRKGDGQILFGLELSYLPDNGFQGADTLSRIDVNPILNESANELLNIVVRALTDPGGVNNRVGYLDRVMIRKATVVFSDLASNTEWLVPSGKIVMERQSLGLRIEADLPFLSNGSTSEVQAVGIYVADTSVLSLDFDFKDIRPSSFAVLTPQLSILSGANLDVNGKLSLTLAVNNATTSVNLAHFLVESGSGILSLPAPIDRSYPIRQLRLDARADQNFNAIVIEAFEIGLGNSGPTISLEGEGSGLLTLPKISAELKVDQVTLGELKEYWPQNIKPNTRNWIVKNLNGGDVSDTKIDFVLSGQTVSDLQVTELTGLGTLSDIAVTYIQQMPPVEDTDGTIKLSLAEVVIDVDSGIVNDIASGGELSIRDGRVRLHGLNDKSDTADIDIRIDGHINDVFALIDNPPLGYASALGIVPSATSGLAEVLLSIDFPLIQGLKLEDVQVAASASLQQTMIAQAAFGLDLESGQFSLEIDNRGMDVRGTASLGGIRTGLTWRENFNGGNFRRQYALDALVENNQRSIIGLGQPIFSPPYVDGPIRMEAIYTVEETADSNLVVEADLTAASLNIPVLNWHKPAQIEAIFSAEMVVADEKLRQIRQFEVVSLESSLQLSGQIDFQNGTDVRAISISPGRFGENDFSLAGKRSEDGVFDIVVDGKSLDGRAFWSAMRESNRTRSYGESVENTERLPFKFTGHLDNVLLSQSGGMENVSAYIEQTPTGLSELRLEGNVNGIDQFTFTLSTDETVRTFEAKSSNGGAVLKALGLSDDFVGGVLEVEGNINEAGSVSGFLSVETFKVIDAPLLARLLSVAALTGIVDELQGTGISFSNLKLPFTYSENIFSINEGAMYGSALGLTAQGAFDTAQNTLDADGTIVPAYAINSAFGSIPLLGPMLTGGEEGGGIFAATYAMRGSPDGAEITVNPLATLTPGFLRKVFRVFDPPPASPATPDALKGDVNGPR